MGETQLVQQRLLTAEHRKPQKNYTTKRNPTIAEERSSKIENSRLVNGTDLPFEQSSYNAAHPPTLKVKCRPLMAPTVMGVESM